MVKTTIGTAYVNKYQAKADMNSYRWEKKKTTIIHLLQMSNESKDSPRGLATYSRVEK